VLNMPAIPVAEPRHPYRIAAYPHLSEGGTS
jgi:hypothetical protein